MTRRFVSGLVRLADFAIAPFLLPAAALMKFVRRLGVEKLPVTSRLLRAVGVFPIRDHYYEPRFDFRHLDRPLDMVRPLPGLDLDMDSQLKLLASFRWADEFARLLRSGTAGLVAENGMFDGADAAFYFNLIRLMKPRRIIEVGSGQSTLVALAATALNKAEPDGVDCPIHCIEPYEAPWLEATGVPVVRRRVETLDASMFAALGAGDILFIDSSHVIRPQGDLVFIFLDVLPKLAKGVIVHVHDIFTPRDYPGRWLTERVYFWNEQYLLEALLSGGTHWRVLASLNHLHHDARSALEQACGVHAGTGEPGSFYIVRQ